jgi:hypothetical protein
MKHYVTNLNLGFLPQGLALYKSMQRHLQSFQFWIVCMDQDCFDALQALNLPNMRLIDFSGVESDAYCRLRGERTVAEYCWTIKPLNPYIVFSLDPMVDQVTSLDADLWFLRDPDLIFQEFTSSGKSVLVTEHAYLPQYDQLSSSGVFCSQWITFVRNRSEPLRKWWQEQCFQWCFNRAEDGKFGDQKYMESWPTLFPGAVHSLSNPRLILAPWNAQDINLENGVAYHFHGLRILDNSQYAVKSFYSISDECERKIYKPYLMDLSDGIKAMKSIGLEIKSQVGSSKLQHSKSMQSFLLRQLMANGGFKLKQFNFLV